MLGILNGKLFFRFGARYPNSAAERKGRNNARRTGVFI